MEASTHKIKADRRSSLEDTCLDNHPLAEAGAALHQKPELPAGTKLDNVHFTIGSPASLAPGQTHELCFSVHLEKQRMQVVARVKEALGFPDRKRILFKSEGPFSLARGITVCVRIEVEDIEVKGGSKPILWSGEIGTAIFLLLVPEDSSTDLARIGLDPCRGE